MPEQRRALWVAKEQNVFANHILDHYPKFGLKELNDTGINWIIAFCKRAKLFQFYLEFTQRTFSLESWT